MRHWLIGLVLGSVYLWAYAASFSAGYVYEDRAYVDRQPGLSAAPFGPRSLTNQSFLLQEEASPLAHHAVNLALNMLVAALVGCWLLSVGRSSNAAWCGVGLILWHPLSTEATAYVAGRGDLIATAIAIAACWAAAVGRRSRASMVVASLLSVLAGAGKDVGLTACALVPATLAVYRCWRRVVASTVAIFVLGLLAWGQHAYNIVHWSIAGTSLGFVWKIDHLVWLRWQATAAVRMIGMVVVPKGMSVVFDVEAVPVSLQWLSVAWLVLLCLVAAWLVRRCAGAAAGLAWILASILPRLFVQTPGSIFNEHQFYFAMPGVALMLASAWDHYAIPHRAWTLDDALDGFAQRRSMTT